jgi:hypothetical protein
MFLKRHNVRFGQIGQLLLAILVFCSEFVRQVVQLSLVISPISVRCSAIAGSFSTAD